MKRPAEKTDWELLILKYSALIALLAGLLPISILVHHKILNDTNGQRIMLDSCFIFIGGYLGFLCSKSYEKFVKKFKGHLFLKLMTGLFCYLVTLGILLSFLLLAFHQDIKALISIGSISIIAYVMVLKSSPYFYNQILDMNQYAILVGICVVCMFFVPTVWITVTFFVITAFYVLIQNQSIVDIMLKRTSKNTQVIRGIRGYNAFLVLLFFALFCLSYSLKNYVFIILKSILMMTKVIIKAITVGIMELFYWFLNTEQLSGSNEIQEYSQPYLETSGSGWTENFILAFGILAAVYFLIRFRWALYDMISKFMKEIKSFFFNIFRIKVSEEKQMSGYCDHVEMLIPEKTEKKERKNKPVSKLWKKEYKDFLKTSDLIRKYRLGYRLMVMWFKAKKVNIVPSDTTLEICEKTHEFEKVQPVDEITSVYNEIRYGERDATEKEVEIIVKTLQDQYQQLGS